MSFILVFLVDCFHQNQTSLAEILNRLGFAKMHEWKSVTPIRKWCLLNKMGVLNILL